MRQTLLSFFATTSGGFSSQEIFRSEETLTVSLNSFRLKLLSAAFGNLIHRIQFDLMQLVGEMGVSLTSMVLLLDLDKFKGLINTAKIYARSESKRFQKNVTVRRKFRLQLRICLEGFSGSIIYLPLVHLLLLTL